MIIRHEKGKKTPTQRNTMFDFKSLLNDIFMRKKLCLQNLFAATGSLTTRRMIPRYTTLTKSFGCYLIMLLHSPSHSVLKKEYHLDFSAYFFQLNLHRLIDAIPSVLFCLIHNLTVFISISLCGASVSNSQFA